MMPVMPAMKIPTTQNKLNVVVYDMDGTLIRGDCGEQFIRERIKTSFWRTLLVIPIAPLAFTLLGIPSIRKFGVSAFHWVATVGMNDTSYAQALNEFIQNYSLRPLQKVLAQCREDIASGREVVVATGASEQMAKGLLQRLQLADDVSLVASQTRWFFGGLISSVQCNGEVKLKELIKQGYVPPYLRVYSDSALDIPILLSTSQPILVNARPRDREKCRLRCPELIEPDA
jgi:phosphatidylglycerophosphatase C